MKRPMHLQESGALDEPDQIYPLLWLDYMGEGNHKHKHLSCYIESKIDQDGLSDEYYIESLSRTDVGQRHGQAVQRLAIDQASIE